MRKLSVRLKWLLPRLILSSDEIFNMYVGYFLSEFSTGSPISMSNYSFRCKILSGKM